jgi:YggT family protein
MLSALFNILELLLSVLWWVIIIQVVLSWLFAFNVLNTSSDGLRRFVEALDRVTEPLYRPIRKILPDFGGIDFSPLILLLAIGVVQILLDGAEASLTQPTI